MLFRKEALAERQTRWLGTVVLVSKPSHRAFTACAAVVMVSVLSLLFIGEFPRKTRVTGWLVPERGLVRVFAPRTGVVAELYAREGAEVQKGDRLFTLSAEFESAALGATQNEVARRLRLRRESLEEERRAIERLGTQRTRSFTDRLTALTAEQSKLDGEIGIQAARRKLAERSVKRAHAMKQAGVASDEHVEAAEESALEKDAALRAMERNRLAVARDRLAIEADLASNPLETRARLARIDGDMAAVDQELAEVEARRELAVTAPEAGTVTTLQIDRGARLGTNLPALSIVPSGSKLEAHVFCPSRAMGFVKPGQRVLLRYQAYPYQKFGHYEGVVESISRSATSPAELPAELEGLTSLVGAGEPVVRITVSLASQAITAYGEPVSLSPGMLLDADVVIERRRLIEWMLEPLYTLSGTWKR